MPLSSVSPAAAGSHLLHAAGLLLEEDPLAVAWPVVVVVPLLVPFLANNPRKGYSLLPRPRRARRHQLVAAEALLSHKGRSVRESANRQLANR